MAGDANLDGTVDVNDFDLLAANFGKTGKYWSDGDYNYDGTVNALDFNALATNYGLMIGSSADVPDAQLAALPDVGVIVPEPIGVAMFAGAICTMIRRRKRKF